jgi:hypothetical protein
LATHLTDAIIAALPKPAKGLSIVRDAKERGLGVRVLASGTRAFVLDYTAAGRRRLYTIGAFPSWRIATARSKARELKAAIRHAGFDPAAALATDREAVTFGDLWERFEQEHLDKLRPHTKLNYKSIAAKYLLPEFGRDKLAAISFSDIDRLHRRISREAPTQANNTATLARRLFNLGIKWESSLVNSTFTDVRTQ